VSNIQISFTNNTFSDVSVFSVDPRTKREDLVFQMSPGGSSNVSRDIAIGTEWRMKNSADGAIVGIYQTTNSDFQTYFIGGYRIQLRFINTTSASVVLFSVDPATKQERRECELAPGAQSLINTHAFPGTEWRVKDAQTGAVVDTFVTTADPFQAFSITQSVINVTDPIIPTGTPSVVITPVLTPGVEITSRPLDPGPMRITPTPESPVTVVGAKDSIFNLKSFNTTVIGLEYTLRQQTELTDKNQRRAVIYARLMEIARSPIRTPEERAVMDWLAVQVKQTRIEAARLALAEYDRWNHDPWGYQVPGGYDFPEYIIPVAQSPIWLTTTPNPPVLANKSWQSFLAEIVSNNGWSPLNNPLLTKGKGNASLENVIGFPVFGTVLAYQKLYGSVEGVGVFAETTATLSSQSFDLRSIGGAIASPGNLKTVRVLNLDQIAPFTQRNLKLLVSELIKRISGVAGRVPIVPGAEKVSTADIIKSCTRAQLRSAIANITSGDVIGSFIASFILSSALQEIIGESIMLNAKIRLRGELIAHFNKQQSAPLPDLANLLHYDIKGEIAVVGAEYQPTDATELERLMGSQEVYRAFLLSTVE
jgi:hypothetical protein